MFAQYSDSTKTAIIAVFDSPQDSSGRVNCEEIDISDSRYIAFYESLPDFVKQLIPCPTAN